MPNRQTTEITRELARITSTYLGIEDHGIFTAWLNVDYGGAGQGVGGCCLDAPPVSRGQGDRRGTAVGMEFILRVLRACGVDSWEKLSGRTIYVLKDAGQVCGIEGLPFDRGGQFIFADAFEPSAAAVAAAILTPDADA